MDNWPSDMELLEYPSLASTNAEGKRLAFITESDTWIFTHKQTDGRGSRGREWFSGELDFTASFLFYPGGSMRSLAQRTFTASLALFDALVYSGVKPHKLTLKWPNDVLLNSKKVSGVLLETCRDPRSERMALVIGIGINLFSCPGPTGEQELNKMATTLKSVLADKTPTARVMLTYLANSLQFWEKVYRDEGFLYVKDAWLNLSYPLGSQVKVKVKGKEYKGYFEGVSENGSFLLKSNDTISKLSIGDVFFGDF